MMLTRFNKVTFLHTIRRDLLAQLFAPFEAELRSAQLALPNPGLDDEAYCRALARLTAVPERLPYRLIEALCAIEDMATPVGQERLEAAILLRGLDLGFRPESTHGDIAVQVWLARPELLAHLNNEVRMTRLASFEYYGSKAPVDRSDSFAQPAPEVIERLTGNLDVWFQAHNRGEETAWVEVHAIEGEFWFLVRHGDTYSRTAKVERRQTEVLHFRPAKDDVVVYAPELDQLRIHAGTKGERQLYRRAFGQRLMGDRDYFADRLAYSLEALRELGPEAVTTDGIEELGRVVFRHYELAQDNSLHDVEWRGADDLFASALDRPVDLERIPAGGRLVRAAFDVYQRASAKPWTVEVIPPNRLKLGRGCEPRLVHRWLALRGFTRKADDFVLKSVQL